MATNNQVNVGLSGSTGTGTFVGATSPTIVTPKIAQINDTNSNALVTLTTSASAVNYLDIKNGATGAGPILTSVGTDTNIGMTLSVKAAGSYAFQSTTSANYVIISPNVTGNAPTIYGSGSDTNVNLQLQTKGTGQLALVSANTTSPIIIYNGTGNQHTTTFSMSNTLANRTVTFPDADGTLVLKDTNSNISANNFLAGFTATATAAGTTTLTVASTEIQQFTGSTTQTVTMPVTSTLVAGQSWQIINNSSGTVTVQSSGSNTIVTLSANTAAIITCILTSGTTAASWTTSFTSSGSGSGTITDWVAYTPTFTGFGTVSSVQFWSRRVGDTLYLRGRFVSGTSTAVEARVTLGYAGTNANVNSSSTKITSIQVAGSSIFDAVVAGPFYTLIESNIGYITFGGQLAGRAGLTKINGSTIISSGTALSLMAEIPIDSFP